MSENLKPFGPIVYGVVHCAATPADMDIGVADIRRWHLKRGFADVGYHYIIRRDGTEEIGRPETRAGAHAVGYNLNSLAVCLVGGLKKGSKLAENNFTGEQFERLWARVTDWRTRYPGIIILGHRDLDGVKKACPSFDVREWLAKRDRVLNPPT